MRRLILLVTLHLIFFSINAQSFTAQQKAYLYHIVQKTPVLNRNLQSCFIFDKEPFRQTSKYKSYIDYNAIEYYQINNPDSLLIKWKNISKAAPGLIAEASTLLAIYELNEQLKAIVNTKNTSDSLYLILKKALQNKLPAKIKEKKKDKVLFVVIHPSLPLKIKLQQLNNLKLKAKEQERIMNQWRVNINQIISNRSKDFFHRINPHKQYNHLLMPAAGEGSGTAGLLYEAEPHPEEIDKPWYGKAIGLFTYELRSHNDEVKPKDMRSGIIQLSKEDGKAFHFSLWGLNSSFKPLVVVTSNNKSYHLFSDFHSMELSPDPSQGEGISFIDRINQTREKLIDEPMKKIQAESSLLTILDKEYQTKQEIETKLETLGLEIDSLKELTPLPEAAINYRRNLIESNLTNLTNKEKRIKNLEDKLTAEYKKLDNARLKVEKMEASLGPNPQNWTKKDDIYTYSDGVWFNSRTQDLVFPDSIKTQEVKIDLLSASYSLQGEQRDEVQLLVNNVTAPNIESKEVNITKNDTLLFTHYFHPDEFTIEPDDSLNIQWDSLNTVMVQLKVQPLILKSDSPKRYKNRKREHSLPTTHLGEQRFAKAEIIINGDTAVVTIKSSTDPVPTQLSALPIHIKQELNIQKSSVANNNYLSALRGFSLLKALNVAVSVDELKIAYPLSEHQIKILWEYINKP
ncbi:hypothetical protein [Carboxylicivirga linearis]|uniref:Uncharacterized protein n=1 Tax=Carboxylicivirga linearis TaxID=1628157 RepID=A0ABS5K1E6_9BACT|nr:hypothetical protein [Carboxylicivirga linearis]MBS2101010.1 hypothetical protein [Carboxylicivirga linearis]